RPEHGDYASSLPLRLARTAGMNPLELARVIAGRVPSGGAITSVDTAPPGFINIRLSPQWLASQVDEIVKQGEVFGNVPLGAGKRLQVEFVSANPVGPIHVGNGRGLALGDTLARVLKATGFEIQREYLVNDAGTQTETFAATLYARYEQLFGREAEIPEGGYPGEYMIEIAEQLKEDRGDSLLRPPGEPYPPELHDLGVAKMVDGIKGDLAAIGVEYDNWFSERSLYEDGTYEKAMALLRERGCIAQREGAVWFVSSALGEEKDNVLVRSTGQPTYFASDIGYHYDKFLLRGFDRVVDVWGAHARIAGILARASDRIEDWSAGDVSLLTHDAELALVRKMLRLPELVEAIAISLEPHQLPYYAVELATAFHDFYEKCRVISDDEALSMARL